jgi:hypothetical protein
MGRLFDQHRYAAAFWLVAAFPVIGVLGWIFLSRRLATAERSMAR